MTIQKITPFLWYSTETEEAAAFYAGIFPNSRVVRVTTVSGAGGTRMVEFELFGQPFIAMSHPRTETFNHAISLMISCADQAELEQALPELLAQEGPSFVELVVRAEAPRSGPEAPQGLLPDLQFARMGLGVRQLRAELAAGQ